MEKSKLYEFLKSKPIAESSLKLYLNNLRRLNDGVFPTNFNFLKNIDNILEKLNQYKPNTRRSYLISIITTLKHDFPKQKKLYDKYYEHLDKYNKEGAVNNEKSATQKHNWIEQSEVNDIYTKITAEVQTLLLKKKLNPAEYEQLLAWLVLSLYTLLKPRRNADYQKCVIVKKMPTEINPDYNYLDLDTQSWKFNNYKTKGTYKMQEMPVGEDMLKVIHSFLKFHPSKAHFKNKNQIIPLLVDYEGNLFKSPNAITRILNKIFDKKIGVSMLRNIFLTDKYSDQMKEMKEDASAMGTSTGVIQNQYVKNGDE